MSDLLPVLILPGLGNSGPDHWQSHWEALDPACVRVEQDDWDRPRCADWVARLDQVLRARAPTAAPVVLVGHSSACALIAHWAAAADPAALAAVAGAMLVAPSDPDGPYYPDGPQGFGPVPRGPLPFPSLVVASDDDRYVAESVARAYAAAWGSRYVLLNGADHINAASGFGPWPDGRALLSSLRCPVP